LDALDSFCLTFPDPLSLVLQHTSVSPDSKTIVVVGDNSDGLLTDSQNGKVVILYLHVLLCQFSISSHCNFNLTANSLVLLFLSLQVIGILKGHSDYSFASAWHPGGVVFATGNQDMTCRLWDSRYLGSSLAVLKGRIGAIRSIRFTSDGRFMMMAEPADFVHLLDTKQDYAQSQEIDLFGEVAGVSFSPDSEAAFVGISDRNYGSLVEFNRSHANTYLNCLL
jgi:WD40 repeat protein